MVSFAICDEDNNSIKEIEKCIKEEVACSIAIAKCNNATLFKRWFLQENKMADIYILHLSSPYSPFAEMAKAIKELQREAIFIVVTNHNDLFANTIGGSFSYIPRLENRIMLKSSISKAVTIVLKRKQKPYIVIQQSENRAVKISYNDILSLQKYQKYVEFHLKNGNVFKTRNTLQNILAQMNDGQFFLISRGIAINLANVEKIENNILTLCNNSQEYISRSNVKAVREALLFYWKEYLIE